MYLNFILKKYYFFIISLFLLITLLFTVSITNVTKKIDLRSKATTPNSQWSADNVNYFDKWSCSSATGINHISKLGILPSGTHSTSYWKDSLYADFRQFVGGNPVIYFTSGDYNRKSLFSLEKAIYSLASGTWEISNILTNSANPGGISSFDGTQTDYIMNEYYIPGWGPTDNKKGSESKIPGVRQNHVYSSNVNYPLWGIGPLGLSTIREKIQGNYDRNVNTCLHMNPTLFNFDSNGIPHSFMAQLFANTPSTPCTLPNGTKLQTGYYVYNFVNNTIGWQIDLNKGLVYDTRGLDNAFNFILGTTKFLKAIWEGKIDVVNLNDSAPRTAKTVLDCSKANVFFSEPSGREDWIYFLADPPPHFYKSGTNDVYIHDIFVAFHTN